MQPPQRQDRSEERTFGSVPLAQPTSVTFAASSRGLDQRLHRSAPGSEREPWFVSSLRTEGLQRPVGRPSGMRYACSSPLGLLVGIGSVQKLSPDHVQGQERIGSRQHDDVHAGGVQKPLELLGEPHDVIDAGASGAEGTDAHIDIGEAGASPIHSPRTRAVTWAARLPNTYSSAMSRSRQRRWMARRSSSPVGTPSSGGLVIDSRPWTPRNGGGTPMARRVRPAARVVQ